MPKPAERPSAKYLASLCKELAALADRDGFQTAAYLLEMAGLDLEKQQQVSDQSTQDRAAS
jgi:hypothetical protein